jgi:hypothetical protein
LRVAVNIVNIKIFVIPRLAANFTLKIFITIYRSSIVTRSESSDWIPLRSFLAFSKLQNASVLLLPPKYRIPIGA